MQTRDKRLQLPTPSNWIRLTGGDIDSVEAYVMDDGDGRVTVDWTADEGYEIVASDRPATARISPRRERAKEIVKEAIERIDDEVDYGALERVHLFPDPGEVWQYRPERDTDSFLSTDIEGGQSFVYVRDSDRDTGQVNAVVLGGSGEQLDSEYTTRGEDVTVDGDWMVASDDWLPVSLEAAAGMRFVAHLNGIVDHPDGIEIRKRK